MSILASLKNTLDEVRVQVYPRNETEKKVYDALSSKNWGASSTLLNEIANESHDYEKFNIISTIVWASLETEGKTWKQVFKALTLIDFLVKNGAERFIESCRDRLFKIRALQDYNYYEGNIDKGSGIREKAKQLVELLNSNELIREEREKARALRNKFQGFDSRSSGYGGSGYGGGSYGGSYGNSGIGGDSYNRTGGYGGSGSDSHNRSGSYGGNSRYGDSYSDSQTRRGSDSGGRYGGGSYMSDRPNRYSDDTPEDRSSSHGEQVEHTSKPAPSSQAQTTSKSSGGKIKVNIKKVPTAPQKVEEPEVDLMGGFGDSSDFDPFSAAPATSMPAPAAADFDPFGPAPTSAHTSTNAQAFDPFAAAPMAPPTTNVVPPAVPQASPFDPFGAAPGVLPAATPMMANNMFAGASPAVPPAMGHAFPPTPAMSHTPAMGVFPPQSHGFPMAPMPPAPAAPMGPGAHANAFGAQAPMPQPAMTTRHQPSAPVNVPAHQPHSDADFGDFTTAPSATSTPKTTAATDKWGDLSKLVDLGKIEKNEDLKAKQAQQQANSQSYANNSFAGLDGFSKIPQSMASGGGSLPRPMGSMGAPMGQPMGAPIVGQGMSRPMGAPMGQPMGQPMGPPMGQPMAFGGAPGAPMGYGAPGGMGMGMGMGAPMGQMGGHPGGMNMGMGMGAPGQQQMGMYGQNQPGFGGMGGFPQQGYPQGNFPPRGF